MTLHQLPQNADLELKRIALLKEKMALYNHCTSFSKPILICNIRVVDLLLEDIYEKEFNNYYGYVVGI